MPQRNLSTFTDTTHTTDSNKSETAAEASSDPPDSYVLESKDRLPDHLIWSDPIYIGSIKRQYDNLTIVTHKHGSYFRYDSDKFKSVMSGSLAYVLSGFSAYTKQSQVQELSLPNSYRALADTGVLAVTATSIKSPTGLLGITGRQLATLIRTITNSTQFPNRLTVYVGDDLTILIRYKTDTYLCTTHPVEISAQTTTDTLHAQLDELDAYTPFSDRDWTTRSSADAFRQFEQHPEATQLVTDTLAAINRLGYDVAGYDPDTTEHVFITAAGDRFTLAHTTFDHMYPFITDHTEICGSDSVTLTRVSHSKPEIFSTETVSIPDVPTRFGESYFSDPDMQQGPVIGYRLRLPRGTRIRTRRPPQLFREDTDPQHPWTTDQFTTDDLLRLTEYSLRGLSDMTDNSTETTTLTLGTRDHRVAKYTVNHSGSGFRLHRTYRSRIEK